MAGAEWDPALEETVAAFPPVRYAFAYGSGVFPQPGLYDAKGASKPMLDFIFVVDDPEDWHRQNLSEHRSHYSCVPSLFGAAAPGWVADRVGCGVYFNTMVPMANGRTIKYGVASARRLVEDLEGWTTLFLAGRLHKPVAVLRDDPAVARAQRRNLDAALAAGLLLGAPRAGRDGEGLAAPSREESLSPLPLPSLLSSIAGLSYAGDVRSGIAEDPRKVSRIVAGSGQRMAALYAHRWEALFERGSRDEDPRSGPPSAGSALFAGPEAALAEASWPPSEAPFEAAALHVPTSTAWRAHLLSKLPRAVQRSIVGESGNGEGTGGYEPGNELGNEPGSGPGAAKPGAGSAERAQAHQPPTAFSAAPSASALLALAAQPALLRARLSTHLRQTVARSSKRGAAASLLSAGIWRGGKYLAAKIKKRIAG